MVFKHLDPETCPILLEVDFVNAYFTDFPQLAGAFARFCGGELRHRLGELVARGQMRRTLTMPGTWVSILLRIRTLILRRVDPVLLAACL